MAEAFLMGQSGGGLKVNDSSIMSAQPMTKIKEGDLVEVRNGYGFGVSIAQDWDLGYNSVYGRFSFSPSGRHLLVAGFDRSALYSLDGDTATEITIPSPPNTNNFTVDWHPNGEMFAIGSSATGKLFPYRFNGTTATAITKPTVSMTGNTNKIDFSPNGKFLAIGGSSSPFLEVKIIENGSFRNQPLNSAPTGIVRGLDFSPDGKFLAVAHEATPYLTIYAITPSFTNPGYDFSFDKLPNPTNLPTGNALSVKFSRDSKKLVVGHNNSPFMTTYSINGNTFTKDANPSVLPTSAVHNIESTPDGHLVLIKESSRYVGGYRLDGNGILQRYSSYDLGANTNDNSYHIGMSKDGTRFVAGKNGAPYVQQFKGTALGITANKSSGTTETLKQPNVLHLALSEGSGGYGDSNISVSTLPIK